MKDFEIGKPLDWCIETQKFGLNFLDFYSKLGLAGHNGIDFRCSDNILYATHDGVVLTSGQYGDGGIGIETKTDETKQGYFKTMNYHLKNVKVLGGDRIFAGQAMGITDNTGIYTTGDHLHFGLKSCDSYGNTLNYNNGYKGAIDPTPFFKWDFYNLPVDSRYGIQKNWYAEWQLRFRNAWVHRQLKKRYRHPLSLTSREVNAIIYGAWDFDIVVNPSMANVYCFTTKNEYHAGHRRPAGFKV